MTTIERLRALLAEATPGPWAWFHNKFNTYLATPDRGRIFVMGFARRGMNGAQPTFQVRPDGPGSGVMRTAAELGDGLSSHPDAALIVEAVNVLPKVLDELGHRREAMRIETWCSVCESTACQFDQPDAAS